MEINQQKPNTEQKPVQQNGNAKPNGKKKVKTRSYMRVWFAQYYKQTALSSVLVIVLLGYLFAIGPKLSTARDIKATLESAETGERSALEQRLTYLVRLDDRRAEVDEQTIQTVYDMLPSEPRIPELIASLDSIGNETGIVIEGIDISYLDATPSRDGSVNPDLADIPPGVQAIEITMGVGTSSYDLLKTLLGNIEKSLRLMDVTGLLYSPIAKNYTVTLRSYYQP